MTSNLEGKVIDNTDKIAKLKKEVEELKNKVTMLDSLLDTLKPFYKRMLELKYKKNLSLEAIASDYGRSVKSVQRTINNYLKKINKIYIKNVE